MALKCRVCLFKIEHCDSVDLFTPAKTGQLIADCLSSFAQIQIVNGDGLPDRMCKVCEEKVNILLDFQMTLIASDTELRKMKDYDESNLVLCKPPPKEDCNKVLHSEKLLLEDPLEEYQYNVFPESDSSVPEQETSMECSSSLDCDTNTDPYTCPYCDKSFKLENQLKEHLDTHRLEDGAYKCSLCGKVFDNFFESKEHWHEHVTDIDAEPTNPSSMHSLPHKSRRQYEFVYGRFMEWCNKKTVKTITESVLLTYFAQKSESLKSSTLWAFYSMLKATLSVKHNIDISTYKKLLAFLKRKSVGYRAKKSESFTRSQVNRFLKEAPDAQYLMMKVALIVGIAGSCGGRDLARMSVDDVEDIDSALIVRIPESETAKSRSFTIINRGDNTILVDIYRKYLKLRPARIEHRRLFINYRNGKCSTQAVGRNTFGAVPSQIAKYLGLENTADYNGYCFRRSVGTLLVDAMTGVNFKRKREEQ